MKTSLYASLGMSALLSVGSVEAKSLLTITDNTKEIEQSLSDTLLNNRDNDTTFYFEESMVGSSAKFRTFLREQRLYPILLKYYEQDVVEQKLTDLMHVCFSDEKYCTFYNGKYHFDRDNMLELFVAYFPELENEVSYSRDHFITMILGLLILGASLKLDEYLTKKDEEVNKIQ